MNRSEIKKIGGSDIAAILGLLQWKSAHSLYLHLIGELPPQEDSFVMKRGRELEPDIARRFALDHPEFEVVEHGIVEDTEYDFLIGSPDRLLLQGGEVVSGLEVKTCDINQKGKWYNEAGEEDIPLPYYVQSLWYCGMLRLPDYHIAVDFLKPNSYTSCGIEYRHFEFSVEQYGELRERAVAFWHDHVIPKIPPEITVADNATIEYYKHRYPQHTPDKWAYSDEKIDELAVKYLKARKHLEEEEMLVETMKCQLIAIIGENEGLKTASGNFTYRTSKPSKKINWEAIALMLGASGTVIDSYTTELPGSRRFLTPKQKG